MSEDLLARLERYYDEAPRAGSDIEEHGPFTVFVSRGGWPYYARPRLGGTDPITPEQVTAVLDRLEELGQPRSIEWVHDTTPSLRAAATAAGVEVGDYPLLVLDGEPVVRASPVAVRRLAADDPELGPVGGGSHNPRGAVTEIVGVGVLPAVRRRGIAGHLTWALTADAAEAGVDTVFMSAGSDDVARIYEGVGFRRVGTACIVG